MSVWTEALDLEDGDQRLVQVETKHENFEALHPTTGERLHVRPRQVRIFVLGHATSPRP